MTSSLRQHREHFHNATTKCAAGAGGSAKLSLSSPSNDPKIISLLDRHTISRSHHQLPQNSLRLPAVLFHPSTLPSAAVLLRFQCVSLSISGCYHGGKILRQRHNAASHRKISKSIDSHSFACLPGRYRLPPPPLPPIPLIGIRLQRRWRARDRCLLRPR